MSRLVALVAALASSAAAAVHAESDEIPFETVRGVTYVERPDGPLKVDLCVPRGEGPFPAVLVVHGGGWMSGHRTQLAGVARQLATKGFTTAAISYRLAPRHQHPAQIDDCRVAVRWMRTNGGQYKIDPERIGGFGYSAGAHLVSLLGTAETPGRDDEELQGSTRLQAVVGGGTPCDFRFLPADSRALAYWLGGTRRERPEAYRTASPLVFVSKGDPPFFLYHGEKDRLVPLLSPRAMEVALKRSGVEVHVHTIPECGHIRAALDRKAADEAITFLERHLKPAPDRAVPSAERSSPAPGPLPARLQ